MPRATELLVLAAALLGGCSLEIPFDVAWSLPVAGQPGALGVELPMDLGDQEVWSRRDDVDELHLETVGLKVIAIGARNRAEVVALRLGYRPEGADGSAGPDVVVMEPIEMPLAEGSAFEVAAPPQLEEAVQDALRGSGRFTLVFEAEADGPVEATMELTMSGTAMATP